jgi:acyl transferase domain-containing protein
VVLEEAPDQPIGSEPTLPVLIAISAATPKSLGDLAAEYAKRVEEAKDGELAAIGYTSTVRRTHHRYRLAVSGSDGRTIARGLRERAASMGIDPRATAPWPPSNANGLSDPQRRLVEVALAWEQGGEVDWTEVYPSGGKIVSLPQYPFGGRRYWLSETVAPVSPRVPFVEEQSDTMNLDERENPRATDRGTEGNAAPHDAPTAMSGAAVEDNPEISVLVSQLQKLSSRDRYEQLLSFVASETRSLFGMPEDEPLDENRGLVEMGMDSLMAVMLQNELQSQLGVQLSATVVLDYPNLASLAKFLDDKLFARSTDLLHGQSATATKAASDQDERDLDSVTMLSDAEMDAALQAELVAIRKLGVQ